MQVVFAAILAETSPRALPLDAACLASALKAQKLAGVSVALADISYGEAAELGLSAAEALNGQILKLCGKGESRAAKAFGADIPSEASAGAAGGKAAEEASPLVAVYTVSSWNANDCAASASVLRQKLGASLRLVCAGSEVAGLFRAAGESGSRAQNAAALPVPEHLKPFDYAVVGEGESALAQLIREIAGGSPRPAKLALRFGAAENLAELPSPWLDKTVEPFTYNGVLWELSRGRGADSAAIAAEAFICETKDEPPLRKVPLARLEKELALFAEKRVPQVFVRDAAFCTDKERALKLLHLMAQKLPDAQFDFAVPCGALDKPLAQAFSQLACSLQIALQSANPQALANIGRKFDRKAFARKAAMLNDFGLVFGFDLVLGLPADTLPSFRENLDYALSLFPNHVDFFRLAVPPGTPLRAQAERFGIKYDGKPPYHVQCSPTFSAADLAKAESLAFACDVFYSAGRAVPWFLSLLRPLRIKPSQFLADFAEWQRCNNCARGTGFNPESCRHQEIERMQLSFLQFKYEEKRLGFALPAVRDVVRLNGALARACAEREETVLEVSYSPDDIFCGEASDILAFADEACMENCRVRVFARADAPDYEVV